MCVSSFVVLLAAAAAYGGQAGLGQGASGDDVLGVQTALQAYGYYNSTLDGAFGPVTHRAVIRFQRDCGLPADGVVDEATMQALEQFDPALVMPSRGSAGDRQGPMVVAFAEEFLGAPYVWAGSSPSGFDCSGFTSYIFSEFGVSLSHGADLQFREGYQVNNPQVGDLVFFSTYESGPSHVGIYMGDDLFIHASSAAGDVCITTLSSAYYTERYLGARRVLD